MITSTRAHTPSARPHAAHDVAIVFFLSIPRLLRELVLGHALLDRGVVLVCVEHDHWYASTYAVCHHCSFCLHCCGMNVEISAVSAWGVMMHRGRERTPSVCTTSQCDICDNVIDAC
jgi:hypothetical protein